MASERTPLSGPDQLEATFSLTAGLHKVEIVQKLDTDVPIAGLTLSAIPPGQSQPMQMNVTPY